MWQEVMHDHSLTSEVQPPGGCNGGDDDGELGAGGDGGGGGRCGGEGGGSGIGSEGGGGHRVGHFALHSESPGPNSPCAKRHGWWQFHTSSKVPH